MITQRQAEKEEQQRIKNLVLNYDLRENEETDGEEHLTPYGPSINIHHVPAGHEKTPSHHHHNRLDNRSSKERGQRVRKLQFSDVDWYDIPGTRPLHEQEQVPSALQGRKNRPSPGGRRRNLWPTPVRRVGAKEEHD
jgi:regulator of nonsense transcripts 2